MRITDYDRNFFRILGLLRQPKPCVNFTKYSQETKDLAILWLHEMTGASLKDICDLFGMVYTANIASKAAERVNKDVYHEFRHQMYDRMVVK